MGLVEVENLSRSFGNLKAMDRVSLDIEEGELFALLGPSGCGKTTTLRSIAGFERPDSGDIRIANRSMTALAPNQRPIGMVFQAYALFPHMTVFDNVAYGLYARNVSSGKATERMSSLFRMLNRRLSKPTAEVTARVKKVLATVELSGLETRFPSQLSGGQQQRVALARALVVEPTVLLMDEPLSNLDRKLRDSMRVALRQLLKQIGITTIFVTHDQEEAMSMADRVAVMNLGVVQQVGLPEEIYKHPRSEFVAGFIGGANFISGTPTDTAGPEPLFETEDGIRLSYRATEMTSTPKMLMIRPENLVISSATEKPAVMRNQAVGTVIEATYFGATVQYEISLGRLQIRATVPASGHVFAVGAEVLVTLPPEQLLAL
jgi:ABC-type Fe3+/spermidine/putrescine transport system ATPase subunit